MAGGSCAMDVPDQPHDPAADSTRNVRVGKWKPPEVALRHQFRPGLALVLDNSRTGAFLGWTPLTAILELSNMANAAARQSSENMCRTFIDEPHALSRRTVKHHIHQQAPICQGWRLQYWPMSGAIFEDQFGREAMAWANDNAHQVDEARRDLRSSNAYLRRLITSAKSKGVSSELHAKSPELIEEMAGKARAWRQRIASVPVRPRSLQMSLDSSIAKHIKAVARAVTEINLNEKLKAECLKMRSVFLISLQGPDAGFDAVRAASAALVSDALESDRIERDGRWFEAVREMEVCESQLAGGLGILLDELEESIREFQQVVGLDFELKGDNSSERLI